MHPTTVMLIAAAVVLLSALCPLLIPRDRETRRQIGVRLPGDDD